MKDIKQSDINGYVGSFHNSIKRIGNGADKLCICDFGSDLAQPYDLEINYGIISPPGFTAAAALTNMYSYMKVIVILTQQSAVPGPYDTDWATLDELFVPRTGDCNGQTITDAAKRKLNDFYITRATIYAEIA